MPEWHLITGEYPPQPGGVSDYSRHVAAGLAALGDRVHVWCPPDEGEPPSVEGVEVHRALGAVRPADLRRVARRLDAFPPPRRILVQWVPHAFGYRAMNLPFAAWLWSRARAGDQIGLMVHEAHVAFGSSWKENVIAAVNRLMDVCILRAARRVWVATPAWARVLSPYRLGRRLDFEWLPVPSNIPRVVDPAGVHDLRDSIAPPPSALVGHFGTYGRLIAPLLDRLLPPLLAGTEAVLLLLGRGAREYRDAFVARNPAFAERVVAPVIGGDVDLSMHLAACDLFVQPYPEGLSSRRGSAMAVVAHGRPMVTNRGRYTEAVWDEWGAAELVPFEAGTAGMAIATGDLLRDAAKRGRMAAAAEALYDARFDVRHTVEAIRGPVAASTGAGATSTVLARGRG